MDASHQVYLATVSIERNRWASRQPSLRVSDWLERFAADGFDGIELWENHFLAADAEERARLIERAAPIAVFNTYAGFSDAPEDAEARAAAADAVAALKARGVKYNLGRDTAKLDEYRANLLTWAERLPASCRLLCECHPGTVLEEVEAAAAFFDDLDPVRFAVIAHLSDDPGALAKWVSRFGDRLQHLHMQRRTPEHDPASPTGKQSLAECVAVLADHDYHGSASIEFTRGIGRDEEIEQVYAHAVADRNAYLEMMP